jgi:hypothetical protein
MWVFRSGSIQAESENIKENHLTTYFRNNKSLGFECVSKSGPGSARVFILSKIGSLKLKYFKVSKIPFLSSFHLFK